MLVLVPQFGQILWSNHQEALVLAADDPSSLEERKLRILTIEFLCGIDEKGGKGGILEGF